MSREPRSINSTGALSNLAPLYSLCALCVLCGSTSAAPDTEAAKPYKLTVVLRVADHPLLTTVFKEQLQRELGDSLRDALGTSLVQLDVVTTHPILDEVDKRGLHAALESYKNAEPGKTHVVLVDYVGGKYEVKSGQHDGLTGLATPVIRRARLDDPAGRQLVARTAALMVQRDFGLVGTVVGDTRNPNQVRIALKGGKLGVPFDTWVKPNDVFALVQVNRLGGAQPVRDAVLQVVEPPDKDGACVCRLFARHYDADPASRLGTVAGVEGYRCLKLGTADAPLRLRLVNDRGLPHFRLQVKVIRGGFDPAGRELLYTASTNREGYVETPKAVSQLACVVVQNGDAVVARIPVPIWEDHVAVRALVLDANSTRLAELIALRDRYNRRLDDAIQLQQDLGGTLVNLLGKKQHEEALAEARKGLARLQGDLSDLDAEQRALALEVDRSKTEAKFPEDAAKDLLADGGRRQHLDAAQQQLKEFIADWSAQVQRGAAQKELAGMVAQARLLKTNEARYDDAIKLYEQAFKQYGAPPELEKELRELKAAWELKPNPEHADARRWIYHTWPELKTPDKMLGGMDAARKHFEACKAAGDRLTPRKMLLTGMEHVKQVQQQMAGLRTDREEQRQQFETLKTVREGLKKLLDDVHAYCSGK